MAAEQKTIDVSVIVDSQGTATVFPEQIKAWVGYKNTININGFVGNPPNPVIASAAVVQNVIDPLQPSWLKIVQQFTGQNPSWVLEVEGAAKGDSTSFTIVAGLATGEAVKVDPTICNVDPPQEGEEDDDDADCAPVHRRELAVAG
jgi:hypothetical protein